MGLTFRSASGGLPTKEQLSQANLGIPGHAAFFNALKPSIAAQIARGDFAPEPETAAVVAEGPAPDTAALKSGQARSVQARSRRRKAPGSARIVRPRLVAAESGPGLGT
jgi:hypothetical protein